MQAIPLEHAALAFPLIQQGSSILHARLMPACCSRGRTLPAGKLTPIS